MLVYSLKAFIVGKKSGINVMNKSVGMVSDISKSISKGEMLLQNRNVQSYNAYAFIIVSIVLLMPSSFSIRSVIVLSPYIIVEWSLPPSIDAISLYFALFLLLCLQIHHFFLLI